MPVAEGETEEPVASCEPRKGLEGRPSLSASPQAAPVLDQRAEFWDLPPSQTKPLTAILGLGVPRLTALARRFGATVFITVSSWSN